MDKAITKKAWPLSRIITVAVIAIVVVTLTYLMLSRSGSSRLKVDPTRLTTAQVVQGEFLEYYPFDGTVAPIISVLINLEEGGRVDEVLLKGNQDVKKGDLILRLSNPGSQRGNIETETRLLEVRDRLSTTESTLAQQRLNLKDQLLQLEYQINEQEKKFKRTETLHHDGIISQETFDNIRDNLNYMKEKRLLLKERMAIEDKLAAQQLEQTNISMKRNKLSLELLNWTADSLDVRAPIAGFLSDITIQVGQIIARGQSIGRVDQLGAYKIVAKVDQFYLNKITMGTKGKFELDGKTYNVAVKKANQDVNQGTFMVEVGFVDTPPEKLTVGQTLSIEFILGEPTKSLMVAKGGFSQQTGGRWVYLLSADKQSARRVAIRANRQNPQAIQIEEGLQAGDWIISSGYEAFNNVDELQFTKPIQLNQPKKTK